MDEKRVGQTFSPMAVIFALHQIHSLGSKLVVLDFRKILVTYIYGIYCSNKKLG